MARSARQEISGACRVCRWSTRPQRLGVSVVGARGWLQFARRASHICVCCRYNEGTARRILVSGKHYIRGLSLHPPSVDADAAVCVVEGCVSAGEV